MADFVPVRTDWPTPEEVFADFARGINAIHTCVHEGQDAQAARDAVADGKRNDLASEMGAVKKSVGAIETRVDIAEGAVSALAKAHGAKLPEGAKPMKVKADMSWKDIGKIAGTVLSGFAGFVLLLQIFGPPTGHYFAEIWKAILAANP